MKLETRNILGISLIIIYIVFSFIISFFGYGDFRYYGLIILGVLELALSFYYVMIKEVETKELVVEVLTSITILAAIVYVYVRFVK